MQDNVNFNMKISIITVCYNRASVIQKAIESVLAQTYKNIEYIVVDGASTDGSMKVIESYKNRIQRIVSEPDHGMYEAINKGIRMATGDVVGLMHSDDYFYDNQTVESIAQAFEESGADLVYGNGVYVEHDRTERMVRKWISGEYQRKKVARGWLPLHPTVYIRREKMEELGLYNESFHIAADSELLVRYLYKADLKVHYLNRYITVQRMGGLSTCTQHCKEKWSEDLRMYRMHGIPSYYALCRKVLSKIPQFLKARI